MNDLDLNQTAPTIAERNRLICDAHAAGTTAEELGRRWGISVGQINAIVRAGPPAPPSAGGELVVPLRPGSELMVPQHVRDNYLPPTARALVIEGIPKNTLETYTKAWVPFRAWCEEHHRTFAPVSEATMITYLDSWRSLPVHVKCRGGRQLNGEKCTGHRPSPSAMWIWYSAVKFYHRVGSPPLPWETGESLARAMIGYASFMMNEADWAPDKAPRAYEVDVKRMVDVLDLSKPKHLRDRAIILVGFYTAARASDLATYRLSDVEHFPRGIRLRLRRSKTNKNIGKKVEYRRVFANEEHPQYCGVEALHSYLDWLRGQGILEGAIFRPFNRWGQLVRGKADAIDYRMDTTSISEAVKDAAVLAGVPAAEDFTQHSLRRGRASQQRDKKVDALDIARAYGWVPGGAINEYLDEADWEADDAPGAVGLLG
jgi:hypothetical protein